MFEYIYEKGTESKNMRFQPKPIADMNDIELLKIFTTFATWANPNIDARSSRFC